MRSYYLLIVIVLITCLGCSNTSQRDSETLNKNDSITYKPTELETRALWEIRRLFDGDNYFGLQIKITSFIESYPDSPYKEDLNSFIAKIILNQTQDSIRRYSLSKFSATKYFQGLNLPRLDSITENNYLFEMNYKLNFIEFDKKIFKPEFYDNWYLSLQESNDFISIAICSFDPCQNEITLYSLDNEYKVISKLIAYWGGCIVGPASDFHFKGQIINEGDRRMVTKFNSDKTFTILEQTYYTLEDSLTGKMIKEIGSENNITYKLDSFGKFVMLFDKSFKKEYIDPLYNEPF